MRKTGVGHHGVHRAVGVDGSVQLMHRTGVGHWRKGCHGATANRVEHVQSFHAMMSHLSREKTTFLVYVGGLRVFVLYLQYLVNVFNINYYQYHSILDKKERSIREK